MRLRRLIKAVRWYAFAPLKRWRYFRNAHCCKAAAAMHWSTELNGTGFFECADSVIIGRRTRLSVFPDAALVFREGIWIGDDCELSASKTIRIGAHTSLQNRSIILGDVSIGAGCVCGPNLYISSSWHHFEDVPYEPIRWQDARAASGKDLMPLSRAVEVGEDCWIGINVVIAPGVRIGRGCIIGANSVVTKDLPPYSVAAGVPAKVIRERLKFTPPKSLSAKLSEHLPYFYAGFRQWGEDVDNLSKALDGEGWRTEKEFKLAVDVAHGARFHLHVRASAPGEIRHGSQVAKVMQDEPVVKFTAELSDDGLLNFEWLSYQADDGAALVVVGVDQER